MERARPITRALAAVVGVLAGAYAVLLALRLGDILTVGNWNPDTVIAWVLTATPDGDGPRSVVDGSYGFFSVLWFDSLTEHLPWHRVIWEAQPALLALATAALIAAAVARVAGRAAAALAFVLTVCVSREALLVYLRPTMHGQTFFAAVVLAAYAVELARPRPFGGPRRWAAASVLVAVITGVHLTDSMLWVIGIVPLLVAIGAWAALHRDAESRRALLAALGVAGASVVVWQVVAHVMTEAGYRQLRPAEVSVVRDYRDIGPNVADLVRMVGDLGGGALGGLLVALGALTPVVLLAHAVIRRRVDPAALVHLSFWSVVSAGTAAAIVGSALEGVRFVVPLAMAAAAAVPLLWHGPLTLVAALAGSAAMLASMVAGMARDDVSAEASGIRATVAAIERTAEATGARTGFGDYDLASNVTWATHGRVVARPVAGWLERGGICPFPVAVNGDWYRPTGARPTFLLWRGEPPSRLGRPSSTHAVAPGVSMYVYDDDLAQRLCRRPATA